MPASTHYASIITCLIEECQRAAVDDGQVLRVKLQGAGRASAAAPLSSVRTAAPRSRGMASTRFWPSTAKGSGPRFRKLHSDD